ncbi:MAG: Hpt domain-containing protein [Pseudoflavonifractor sp.]
MDAMLERLAGYGADMKGAMGRFLDDEDLYKSCFTAFVGDESFDAIGAALDAGDYEKAFECAHTLKGITGNMGLTPLYEVVSSLVEALRGHAYYGLREYYAAILEQREKLKVLET